MNIKVWKYLPENDFGWESLTILSGSFLGGVWEASEVNIFRISFWNFDQEDGWSATETSAFIFGSFEADEDPVLKIWRRVGVFINGDGFDVDGSSSCQEGKVGGRGGDSNFV